MNQAEEVAGWKLPLLRNKSNVHAIHSAAAISSRLPSFCPTRFQFCFKSETS